MGPCTCFLLNKFFTVLSRFMVFEKVAVKTASAVKGFNFRSLLSHRSIRYLKFSPPARPGALERAPGPPADLARALRALAKGPPAFL